MCGIAGCLKLNKTLNIKKTGAELPKMLDLMDYRGPSDRGVYNDDQIFLGHLRLSIIDLSSAGHQPMESSDGSLIIIHNGEIYNYIEIKKELQGKGYSFKTNTDTEVILAAYQEWGANCVKKFNGMWAFVIWDKKNNKLFVSRDRFGIKPFFYYQNKDIFAFASEIKSLLPLLNNKEINYSFLYNFIDRKMSYGSNETLFKDIQFLLPAHNLTIDLMEERKTKIKSYWTFSPDKFRKKYDYSQPVKTFRNLLIDSVKLRLRSDVPVGVCLSGGIDSSVITCIISKVLGKKVKTFSSIYQQQDYNEKEFIDEVNKECRAEPNFIYPTADKFFKTLNSLIKHHDKPVRMPGAYSQWHVLKCAAGSVTVALDGQGGDELLAGYRYFYPYYLADLIKNFSISKYFKTTKEIKKNLKRKYGKDVLKVLFPCLVQFKHLFNKKIRWQDQILTDDFISKYKFLPTKKEPNIFSSYLDQELYRTFVLTNLPMLLDNEDRISMAFSLESRVPFLDYRLVEFCFGLDYNKKINGYTNKYILREAFKDILPKKIYRRKDKKGFPTPLEYWFCNELKEDLKKIFNSEEFTENNILDAKKIKKIFSKHLAGQDQSRILWRALVIHFWLKEYF